MPLFLHLRGRHGLPALQGRAASLDAVGFQEWLGAKGVHKHSKLQEQPVQTRPGAQRVHTILDVEKHQAVRRGGPRQQELGAEAVESREQVVRI